MLCSDPTTPPAPRPHYHRPPTTRLSDTRRRPTITAMHRTPTADDRALLAGFERHLRARRLSHGTVDLRMRHVEQLARAVPLRHATAEQLEHQLAAADHLAAETMKSRRASWRAFFQWTTRAGHTTGDPSADLAPIRVPTALPRVAPDDAIAAAIARAPLRERAMIQLGRLACLRLTEIATLHTDHRHGRWLHVTGKGDKQRRVPLVPELARTLDELEHANGGAGYYFPGGARSATGHMHPQSVHKLIRAATGHNPHSLRHAGATAAYRATRDLRAVQLMLGHASMAVTQRYLHADDDDLAAAAHGLRIAA